MVFCSLAHGAMLPRPSGCLHTANPSPLLGIELRSVNLSAQPLPKHLSLWCLVAVVQIVGVAHIYFVLGLVAVLFSATLRSLHPGKSPRQLGGFQGVDSFLLSQLPLRSASSILIPFLSFPPPLFLLFYPVM